MKTTQTQRRVKHGTFNTIVTVSEDDSVNPTAHPTSKEFEIRHAQEGKRVFFEGKEIGLTDTIEQAVQVCEDHLDQDGWYTTAAMAKGPWKSRSKALAEAAGGGVLGPYTSRKLAREARA